MENILGVQLRLPPNNKAVKLRFTLIYIIRVNYTRKKIIILYITLRSKNYRVVMRERRSSQAKKHRFCLIMEF